MSSRIVLVETAKSPLPRLCKRDGTEPWEGACVEQSWLTSPGGPASAAWGVHCGHLLAGALWVSTGGSWDSRNLQSGHHCMGSISKVFKLILKLKKSSSWLPQEVCESKLCEAAAGSCFTSLRHSEGCAAGEDGHLLWLHITLGTCGRATPNKELLGAISLKSRSFKQILKPLLEHVVVGGAGGV